MSSVGSKSALAKRQRDKTVGIQKQMEDIKYRLSKQYESTGELLSITRLSLTEIQDGLRQNRFSPRKVLHAFQLRCLALYEQGNSGICELIREAEGQVDNLSDTAIVKSELYGIPVSLKEICCVKGYDSTFGLAKLCQAPIDEDCTLVKALRAVGAIPFVLTTTSQCATSVSGFNPVFGDTYNPYSDKKHEPGGSSSGEAVLLANNGSPIGIGTDAGGSIRIPSAFCGITGLKPTSRRLTCFNARNIFPTALFMDVALGPMGKKVDDLAKVMRALLQEPMFDLDPLLPPMPFNEAMYKGQDKPRLRIGFYHGLIDSHIMQPVPSVRRAMDRGIEILRQNGHELVPFAMPDLYNALKLSFHSFAVDGGQALSDILSGEQLNDHSKTSKQVVSIPDVFRGLVDRNVQKNIGGPAGMTHLFQKIPNTEQMMTFMNDIRAYRMKVAESWVQQNHLDVIICPVWATPAPEVTAPPFFVTPSVMYTMLYNLLDYPAGAVPMGFVEDSDIETSVKLMEEYKKSGDAYQEKLMQQQSNSKGLPLSVQVVGLPFREELVLRVMRELERGNER